MPIPMPNARAVRSRTGKGAEIPPVTNGENDSPMSNNPMNSSRTRITFSRVCSDIFLTQSAPIYAPLIPPAIKAIIIGTRGTNLGKGALGILKISDDKSVIRLTAKFSDTA